MRSETSSNLPDRDLSPIAVNQSPLLRATPSLVVREPTSRLARSFRFVEAVLRNHAAPVFLLWALWLSLESLALGPFSYVRIPENADINLPARLAFAREAANHDVGYWAPHRAGGADRLSQLMACGLDALPYLVLPGWLAHGLFIFTQRFVASYFSFRLARDQLVLGLLPSLYVGLAYSLFSHEVYGGIADGFTLYDGLAVPGVPMILWVLGRLDEARVTRGTVIAAVAGLILALSSGFPIAVFILPLLVLWYALVCPRKSSAIWLFIASFLVGWLVGSIPFLWATLLNASGSQRSAWDVMHLGRRWLPAGMMVLKFARDNALALAIAVWGFIATRGRERHLRVLFLLMVGCIGLVPAHLLVLPMLGSRLGFLAGFSFDRVYLVLPFLAAFCAGVSLEQIGAGWTIGAGEHVSAPALRFQTLLASAALLLVVWQSILLKEQTIWDMKEGSNFAAIFARPDLIELRKSNQNQPPFRVVSAGENPDYVWAYGLESADGYVPLYPKRYQEFWGQVIQPVLNSKSWLRDYYYGYGNVVYLFTPETRLPPSLSLPSESPIRFEKNYNLNLLSLANVRFVVSPVELDSDSLRLLPSGFRSLQLSLLTNSRFRHYLGMLRGEPSGPLLYIYENPFALPRFFLVGRSKIFSQAAEILNEMRNATLDSLRSTAYLESNDIVNLRLGDIEEGDGKILLRKYSADQISLETDSASGKILVVTNTYNGFWKVSVDGIPSAIFPVDHTFQGVCLPPGHHLVVLRYAPPYAPKH